MLSCESVRMKKIKEILWGRIYLWGFRPLYRLENLNEGFWHFVNRAAVQHFKQYGKKELSPLETRIVADLRKTGVAFTSLDELFGNGEKLLTTLTEQGLKKERSRINRTKAYITEYFDEVAILTKDDPFVRAALDERVLTIASTYLGMTPKLQEFTLAEINAVPPGTEKTGSMRWHRDPHDLRLCKMFIYLSDVTTENGPFTYVKESNYGNKYRGVFPQKPPSGIYPPPGEVEKRVNPADIQPCTGKAGTVIFADTSGLHGGGYVKAAHRVMFTAGYLPQKSFLMRVPVYKRGTNEKLSPMQEYAVAGDESLTSRNIFGMLKRAFLGKQSFGTHGTYM